MSQPVSEAQFGRLLSGFEREALHWEAQGTYDIGIEQAAYEAFLAGRPLPPSEVDWWQDWLNQVERQVQAGKTMRRVRVLDEPHTAYQRFELWTGPWHAEAGERIWYLPRARAQAVNLPLAVDWWRLDGQQLIVTTFTDGKITGKELHTDPAVISFHLSWWHLALSIATPAEELTAV